MTTRTTGVAALIGAGFSKWAAGLPVAAELFDFAIEPFGPTDHRKLEVARAAKTAWDKVHPEGSPEQFIAHALSDSNKVSAAVLWYITRRISEPYIWQEWHSGRLRRHVLMIDENRKYERAGVSAARDFFSGLRPILSGIITTNYDLLVEYALGTKLFNYGQLGETLCGRGPYPVSQWHKPVTVQGWIPLSKMHGSISWDLSGRYTDGRRGLTGHALIVAPTPEKTAPANLAVEWELAGRILRESSRLLVFGFAFNPYDEALLNHLREHGRGIEHVAVVDPSPKPDRVKAVWPQAQVGFLAPPPQKGPEQDEWFLSLFRALPGPLDSALRPPTNGAEQAP